MYDYFQDVSYNAHTEEGKQVLRENCQDQVHQETSIYDDDSPKFVTQQFYRNFPEVKCEEVTHKVYTDVPCRAHKYAAESACVKKQDGPQYHESTIGHNGQAHNQKTILPKANEESKDYNPSESNMENGDSSQALKKMLVRMTLPMW